MRAKSAVARPWQRKFLGYSMTWHRQPKLKIAQQSLQAFGGERSQDATGGTRLDKTTFQSGAWPGLGRAKRCTARQRRIARS